MKLSNSLKKRFCKDFSLPIGLFDDDDFYYFIELYDSLLFTKEKLRMLEDVVSTLGGEEQFMQEFNRIKSDIIESVSNTQGYMNLSSDKNPRPYEAKHQYSGQNIYCPQFVGKEIISIDIRKANFFSMKTYDPSILKGAKTWNEFLSHFTDLPYYHESKQLRQVIFGNLLPKRQQAIQKSVCLEIADTIKLIDNRLDVAIVSTDEILILNHPYPEDVVESIYWVLESKLGHTRDDLRIEGFELEQIHPEKSYFIKRSFHDDITFKSVPQIFFAQVFKHYVGLSINEIDRSFFHEGMKATFQKSIYED